MYFEDDDERLLAQERCTAAGKATNKGGFEEACTDPVTCLVLDCMDDDVHGNKHDAGIEELRLKRAKKKRHAQTSRVREAFKKGAVARKTLLAQRAKERLARRAKQLAKAKPAPKPQPPPAVGDPPNAEGPHALPPPLPQIGDKHYTKMQACEAFRIPGGEVRVDLIRSQFGAHCAVHASCKMDRQCKKGPLGHMGAWLKLALDKPKMSQADHQSFKMRDDLMPLEMRRERRKVIEDTEPELVKTEFLHYRSSEEPNNLTK